MNENLFECNLIGHLTDGIFPPGAKQQEDSYPGLDGRDEQEGESEQEAGQQALLCLQVGSFSPFFCLYYIYDAYLPGVNKSHFESGNPHIQI